MSLDLNTFYIQQHRTINPVGYEVSEHRIGDFDIRSNMEVIVNPWKTQCSLNINDRRHEVPQSLIFNGTLWV